MTKEALIAEFEKEIFHYLVYGQEPATLDFLEQLLVGKK